MNDKIVRFWNRRSWSILAWFPVIRLKELEKNTKIKWREPANRRRYLNSGEQHAAIHTSQCNPRVNFMKKN